MLKTVKLETVVPDLAEPESPMNRYLEDGGTGPTPPPVIPKEPVAKEPYTMITLVDGKEVYDFRFAA